MANIQEICNHLKHISKFSKEINSNEFNINEMEAKLLVICEKDIIFEDIFRLIDSDLNQSKSNNNLSKESKLMVKTIDSMIRCLILLNTVEESELISNSNFFIIRLSVIKLISFTIIPFISKYFEKIQELFLSIDLKLMSSTNDKPFEIQFIHKMTKVLITLLNSKSIISKILIEDCFASIIASLIALKHELSPQNKEIIEEELSQFINNSNKVIVMRSLLLLMRCKAIQSANNEISRTLSQCLVSESGLNYLINSVLDCDQTSQQQTTLNQRFQAIGTIVAAIPQLCCSLRQYYESISRQLFSLLLTSNSNYHKISSLIIMSFEKRNRKLTQELIINKILDIFLSNERNTYLSLNNGIDIINNLINSRFDAKKFIPIVSHLFYCRVIIEESISHYKNILKDIITEIFQSIKESVYLLDNILYNNYRLINIFEVCVSDDIIGLKFKDCYSSNHLEEEEFSLKQIDQIVQFIISLLEKMTESFKIDLFLILIERMTFNKHSLLTCSLIDTINDSVSEILINYPEKSIQFVINTFERVSQFKQMSSLNEKSLEENPLESDNEFNDMNRNSLTLCLEILKILMKEKHKLKNKDIIQLKQLLPSLQSFASNDSLDENLRKNAKQLKNKIELYESSYEFCQNQDIDNNEFESAMTQLNDNLMPVRAHALIRLKQLIYAKDKQLLKNKTQLLIALKSCLNDSESYIYLSSVNTLSTLAIVCTDEVLPILMQQYIDSQRTVEERLKVGEVLVRLSKSIGDFGHHYSKQYMNCFLTGIKSNEPAIRISSLSNLGQFCSSLKFGLKPFIVELMSCIEALLKTDESIEVKRSSVMFLQLMLKGIDREVIEAVDQQLRDIYRILRQIYSTTIDDILQLHCQLAIEEIDRIVKQLFTPNNDLTKNIKVLRI